jgi:cytidylate kinase
MNHENYPEHSHAHTRSQLVEKVCRHWETRRQAAAAHADRSSPPARPFSIALEREAGTQGTLIAHEVGRLLGWQVYDQELLELIASEMGLRTALLESVDERHKSWLLEMIEAFVNLPGMSDWGPYVSESSYVHHVVQTVLALGLHGECVIVGRGAAFILPAQTTLRVRLVGPIPERVEQLGRALGISEGEAARQVRTLDRERSDFVRDYFFKDPTLPTHYDLVINVPRLSVSHVAELIVEMVQRLQTRQARQS